jgi:hypothetical protein
VTSSHGRFRSFVADPLQTGPSSLRRPDASPAAVLGIAVAKAQAQVA